MEGEHMKVLAVLGLLVTQAAVANDSLEKDYKGLTDKGEICSVRLRDSEGSASFSYLDDGKRKSCVISHERYYLTNRRDDGYPFGTVGDKSGFKSCKVQVHFDDDGIRRLRMGFKSIFNPFHIYKDCNIDSDTL